MSRKKSRVVLNAVDHPEFPIVEVNSQEYSEDLPLVVDKENVFSAEFFAPPTKISQHFDIWEAIKLLLTKKQYWFVELVYRYGWSYKDTANITKTTVGSVERTLDQAKKRLKRKLNASS